MIEKRTMVKVSRGYDSGSGPWLSLLKDSGDGDERGDAEHRRRDGDRARVLSVDIETGRLVAGGKRIIDWCQTALERQRQRQMQYVEV